MKRLSFLFLAITTFFCVVGHGQTIPSGQPQRVQHPYYQYDGFIEAKAGILLPRRIANFTPKSPAIIYDTVSGRFSVYTGGWKSFQDVAYTADYFDLINRPDLTQYVPTSRTINGYSLTSNVTINKVDIGLSNVQNVDVTNAGNITAGTLADVRLSSNVTLQGNTFNGANQLLQLDAGGKVAYANLPAALMIYKGVWDASTNTPTLADGSGVNGWLYRVSTGGTVNFGSGNISFGAGDYVIYNGSIWQKSGGGDAVVSVNGQQGVVVLTTANISEGGTNYFYTDGRVQTFSDTRYSLLNHEHVYSDIANLSSYTGFDVRYKSISYVPAWADITGKPTFATVATTGAYSDLSGTPSLGSLAALSSIGNSYITDLAWSKVTGAPSFLTTETDPTIYAWAKASTKPTYTYSEVGAYQSGSTVANSTQWNGYNYGGGYASGTIGYSLIFNSTNNRFEAATVGHVQAWLGLGLNAYNSTTFLPISAGSGNPLTGDLYLDNKILRLKTSVGTNRTMLSEGSQEDYLNVGLGFNLVNIPSQLNVSGTDALGTFNNLRIYGTNRKLEIWNGSAYVDALAFTSGSVALFRGVNPQNSYLASYSHIIAGGFGIMSREAYDSYITSNMQWRSDGEKIAKYSTTNGAGFIGLEGNMLSWYTYNGTVTAGTGYTFTNVFSVNGAGAVTATSFSGAGTGLTGIANGLTSGFSYVLNALGSYVWNASALPSSYYYGITSSFVQPSDGWDNYGSVINVQTYSGGGGSLQMYVPYGPSFGGTGLKVRFGNYDAGGNVWTSWKTLLASDNYNSYAPTLTGTGASGTWSINVTGSAGSVAWTNVTGRPTAVSSFTNDAGYITSAVTNIAGTTNQIAVSASTGSVTVSLTNDVVLSGTITSSASYETSDSRLKKLLPGTKLIGQIEALEARLYEKHGRVEYGYFAQDALKIIPTAVKQRADGFYDLSYTQVFVVKIASLEKRVHELEQLLEKIYLR